MASMYAKFDEEAHDGLVSISFTNLFPYMCIQSHTFDLAGNERGLIGRRHFVNTRAAANRYGDRYIGALKICEVVLHIHTIQRLFVSKGASSYQVKDFNMGI